MEVAFKWLELDTFVDIFWISVVLALGGYFLLRLSGKKTLGQMTFPQMVITLAIGNLIISPLSDNKTIVGSLFATLIFILVLMLMEWLLVKSNKIERVVTSNPVLIIRDGKIMEDNLKKCRMTVDQLEGKLREKGIASIKEIKNCTLEVSGNIGYEKYNKPNITIPHSENLFREIRMNKNMKKISKRYD